jgi:hypothetical protein
MPISLTNTAPILPWARYSPRSNKTVISGDDNKPREVPFIGKSFAIDIENGTPGWLLLGKGVRAWKPAPLGSDAPGPNYKRAFSILIYAPKLLGSEAFEMCASTGAHMSFCERLYNECEPEFRKGTLPIVRITEAEAINVGRGESRELHFEIVKYIPRPAAFTEALAKLKAADSAPPNKDTHPGNGADNVGDDFDDEGVSTAKPEPAAEKAAETKPKTRGKKPPEPPSSDILDDPIPY